MSKSGAPTQAEMEVAIRYQYAIAHARKPSEQETSACLTLMQKTIPRVGNVGGLKRMLMAVLLRRTSFTVRKWVQDL